MQVMLHLKATHEKSVPVGRIRCHELVYLFCGDIPFRKETPSSTQVKFVMNLLVLVLFIWANWVLQQLIMI